MANILWAYSASMVKSIKMKDSCEINFHLSIVLLIFAAIYYCLFEVEQKSWEVYAGTILFSSIPIGIGQIVYTVSLTLTRNTGILTLFLSLSIIVGYSYSLVRYHENINPIAVLGGVLIITGLAIVILLKDNSFLESVETKKDTK
jgi:drug/metabolite transporter (DMT)-like permease